MEQPLNASQDYGRRKKEEEGLQSELKLWSIRGKGFKGHVQGQQEAVGKCQPALGCRDHEGQQKETSPAQAAQRRCIKRE